MTCRKDRLLVCRGQIGERCKRYRKSGGMDAAVTGLIGDAELRACGIVAMAPVARSRRLVTISAFITLQHRLQLCVLEAKLARQLLPKSPDLFIQTGHLLGDGTSNLRGPHGGSR